MDVNPSPRQRRRRSLRATSFLCLCHPAVCLVYYVTVLVLLFSLNHPLFGLACLLLTFWQASYLKSFIWVCRQMRFYFLLGCVVAFLTPLLSHRGSHVWFYLFQKPITLESLAYGLYMYVLVVTTLLVFVCLNQALGTGKLLYLFARAAAQSAFMVSMALRFGEQFARRAADYMGTQNVRQAQARPAEQRRRLDKIRQTGLLLAGFCAGALEDGMVISETLRAKAYGRFKRTSFVQYTVCGADIVFLAFVALTGAIICAGRIQGAGAINYFKDFRFLLQGNTEAVSFLVMVLFLLLPALTDGFYSVKRICLSWL